jgi:hypothetical protein
LVGAFGCNSSFAPAETSKLPLPPTLEDKKAQLPKVPQLPCFECHQLAAYESGPRFPHTADTHVDLGHCHRCHRSGGHHGNTVDLAPCKECHEEIPNRAPPPAAPPSDAGTESQ